MPKSDRGARKIYCMPISLTINTGADILRETLANNSTTHQNVCPPDQVRFILGMQGCFNMYKSFDSTQPINEINNHKIISMDAEEAIDKIQHPLMINIKRVD